MAFQIRAEQPEPSELGDELSWKPRLGEALSDDRRHLLIDEARDGILHEGFVLIEHGTDIEQIELVEIGHGERIDRVPAGTVSRIIGQDRICEAVRRPRACIG